MSNMNIRPSRSRNHFNIDDDDDDSGLDMHLTLNHPRMDEMYDEEMNEANEATGREAKEAEESYDDDMRTIIAPRSTLSAVELVPSATKTLPIKKNFASVADDDNNNDSSDSDDEDHLRSTRSNLKRISSTSSTPLRKNRLYNIDEDDNSLDVSRRTTSTSLTVLRRNHYNVADDDDSNLDMHISLNHSQIHTIGEDESDDQITTITTASSATEVEKSKSRYNTNDRLSGLGKNGSSVLRPPPRVSSSHDFTFNYDSAEDYDGCNSRNWSSNNSSLNRHMDDQFNKYSDESTKSTSSVNDSNHPNLDITRILDVQLSFSEFEDDNTRGNPFGCCSRFYDNLNPRTKKILCYASIFMLGAIFIMLGTFLILIYGYGMFQTEYSSSGILGDNGSIQLRFDDHDNYHDHGDVQSYVNELYKMLHEPISISEKIKFPLHIEENLIDTNIPVNIDDEEFIETPFFWKVPNSGEDVVERITSVCLQKVLASDMAGQLMSFMQPSSGELLTYNVDNIAYVNVDLSEREGIAKASAMGLVESRSADIIASQHLNFASSKLFNGNDNYRGRLFTVLRHPVDQVIVSYYNFINTSNARAIEKMTLQQYISSPHMQQNWLTHLLSNQSFLGGPVDEDDLNLAKEILRKKCLIGLSEKLDQSVDMFAKYFGWNEGLLVGETKQCAAKLINQSLEKTNSIYSKLVDQKYKVEYGSEIYNSIVLKNEIDIELYWYAYDLHMAQLMQVNS